MNATITNLVAELKTTAVDNVALVKSTREPNPTYFVAGGNTPATPAQIIAALQIAKVKTRFT